RVPGVEHVCGVGAQRRSRLLHRQYRHTGSPCVFQRAYPSGGLGDRDRHVLGFDQQGTRPAPDGLVQIGVAVTTPPAYGHEAFTGLDGARVVGEAVEGVTRGLREQVATRGSAQVIEQDHLDRSAKEPGARRQVWTAAWLSLPVSVSLSDRRLGGPTVLCSLYELSIVRHTAQQQPYAGR